MKLSWRYLMSFLREEVVEVGHSDITPGLEVWYAYGRLMLNTSQVNYSFGRLDKVFRSAFQQLQVGQRQLRDVLLLGLGAGNVPTILWEYDPGIHVVGVELDPEVLRLAAKHFGMVPGPQLDIVQGDAVAFVERCTQDFDMVVVDLFVDEEVPLAATTGTFLRQLGQLLRRGGCLFFNRLSHTETLREQAAAFGRKMSEALPGSRKLDADLNQVWVYEKPI